MDEETEYATEKLTACIYAALSWPQKDLGLPNYKPTVVAAWDENRDIVFELIHRAFTKYEKAVVNRIGDKEPFGGLLRKYSLAVLCGCQTNSEINYCFVSV